MSVSFVWEVTKPKKGVGAGTSSDIPIFEETFGGLPHELTTADMPRLQAMARVSGKHNLWAKLVDLVERYGQITISAEW